MHKVKSPQSAYEYSEYYDLRWRILRAPWQQPKGTEKDNYEASAFHLMATSNDLVIAVGRIHHINENTAQVRYMAVEKDFQGQGYGKAILNALEVHAKLCNIKDIILDARENAVGFYQGQGYDIINESHTLYGDIRHFRMSRILNKLS